MTTGIDSVANVRSASLANPDTTDQYGISMVRESRVLRSLAAEIDALATRCIEPNVFYESWMLCAALETLPVSGVVIALVRNPTGALTGVFPLQLQRKFRGLPIRVLKSWRHLYCFLCTPLVSASHASETIRAFLGWVESGNAPASVIELELVAGDGPFCEALTAQLQAQPRWASYAMSYERAVFAPRDNPHTGVSGKHLKELRRLQRRLAEHGHCTYHVLGRNERIEPWIERFLELEESGWKGRQRTALASDRDSRGFFTRIALEASARDRIQMLALELDGRAIAMKCNFISAEEAFAFKIAFDERYSKYSPGVLLELFNMQHLIASAPQIRRMDSCAIPQHFMINRLWTGRRAIATYLMARRGLAAALIRQWPRYHQLRRLIDNWRTGAG